MKIKLSLSDECYDEVKAFLTEHGIETDDESEFVLIRKDKYPEHLTVRSSINGSKCVIATEDIITIESFRHTLEIHTAKETYTTNERLYQIMNILDPAEFIRVSNSVIAARRKIIDIIPALSMKFILKMENGDRVDVTRSYYNNFKETFQI